MKIARPPKSLRSSRLKDNIQALSIIAQQRPDDPEAQRRAQVATDLYLQTWPQHTPQQNPAESLAEQAGFPTSQDITIFDLFLQNFYWGQQYLLLFRLSLTIEPRRGLLVQSLSVNVERPYHNYLWLETAKLCPNLSHLEIVENTNGLSRSQFRYLEKLFDACPNVTRFSLNAKASDSDDSLAFQSNKRFFKFWNQLTHVEGIRSSESEDIISISKRCPSLQRLKIDCSGSLDLEALLDASQIWGKTLRTLYLDWLWMLSDTGDTTIAQLLGHLPIIEDVCLGQLHDILPSINALAHLSPPRLKRLRVASYLKWDTDHSPEVEATICDMITAHADTLESISLAFWYDLDSSVLKAIKKAKKLEFLNLEVLQGLAEEEREELQAACPELRIFVNYFGGYSPEELYSVFDWSYPRCGSWGFIPDYKDQYCLEE
ncbi:hypothetical protein FPHYL_7245 [Fusarium phyllophilum]|uniref:Uncharacterized protein n=1 Tax=Fusarium phyllophilum TaxID=47803 RepID=A0A8H5JPF5_9HYPO|nr:hypothetical protein FPHYL_7245 [Fusarium phyllophilum]